MKKDDKKFIYDRYSIIRNDKEDLRDFQFKQRSYSTYAKKFLPPDKNSWILDVACGDGNFLYWLEKNGYQNIIGIDVSPEQLSRARERGVNKAIEADAFEWLKEHLNEYDLISAHDFLEHLEKKEAIEFLKLAHASLKPNGVLFLTTPNVISPFFGRLQYGDFTHETCLTAKSLSQVLKLAGFQNVMVFPRYQPVHGLKSMIRYLFWRIFEICFKFYFLIESAETLSVYTPIMSAVARK